jgi:AraC-like DNA-binding protein
MHPLHLKKNTKTFDKSFSTQYKIVPHMYDIWHFHQELELNYIIKSKGTRFIGDHISTFTDGDMVLVGSNLPHVWKNDKEYYSTVNETKAEIINFHFLEDFAGKDLLQLPEFHNIQEMFIQSARGIRILGETKKRIEVKMKKMFQLEGGDRVIQLIQILNLIGNSSEIELLASSGFLQAYHAVKNDRIEKVINYILNHFGEKIYLDEVAEMANMNASAFSRYFKQATKKSFMDFLLEVRIGFACKLLIENNLNVSGICYESGFNNQSNFNKQFKIATGKSPKEYRNEHKVF